MKVVRRPGSAARERPTQVTRVVEEGTTPPQAPPPFGPWADRELWPWLLLLLVLVVGGIVAAVLLTRHHGKKASPATTVVATQPALTVTVGRTTPKPKTKAPVAGRVKIANLVGVQASTAVKRLREDGLQPVVRSVFSTKPSGIVAAQKPAAGTKVKKGSTVTLNVSKGEPAKPVPDVVGQSGSQAVALLKAAGFVATVVGVPSSKPKGTVIAQKPKAGQQAQGGTQVRLNLSTGTPGTTQATTTPPPPATTAPAATAPARTTPAPPAKSATVTVPDVQGKTLDQARRAIRTAGLVTEIKYVPSTQPGGTVVAQARKPGTQAKRGDHMLINISLGSAPASSLVAVPNVVGQDEATAQTTLQNAGFSVVAEDSPTTDSSQDGKVVDEQPAPGTKAPKGSQIIIYVGRLTSSG